MKFNCFICTCVLVLLVYYRNLCDGAYFPVHCFFNDDCSCVQGDRSCCMFKREGSRQSPFGSCFCCPATSAQCPVNTTAAGQACGCYRILFEANLTNGNPFGCSKFLRPRPPPQGQAQVADGTSDKEPVDTAEGDRVTYENQASLFVGQTGVFYRPDAD